MGTGSRFPVLHLSVPPVQLPGIAEIGNGSGIWIVNGAGGFLPWTTVCGQVNKQPQPNLRPKEPVFLCLCCRGRWGLCSFWKHLCSLMLSQMSFWLLQGLGCSPASLPLSLLVLGLGAYAEEPHLAPNAPSGVGQDLWGFCQG